MRNPLTAVRDHLADRKANNEAVEAYWDVDAASDATHNQLASETDPHRRGRLLRLLGECEIDMSRRYFWAFGADPIDDEDGLDMADSLAARAHLYHLLMEVELAVADTRPRWSDGTGLGHEAGDVLDRMAATPDLPARMRLLEDLYAVVEPIVGGQAAELVACLPAPDMAGWQLLSEHQYGRTIAAARRVGPTP